LPRYRVSSLIRAVPPQPPVRNVTISIPEYQTYTSTKTFLISFGKFKDCEKNHDLKKIPEYQTITSSKTVLISFGKFKDCEKNHDLKKM